MDELRVAGNDGVGRLLEGEHDIESHGALSRPAPWCPASMIPPPAPVTTSHPDSAMARFQGLVPAGSMGPLSGVRAEPKTATLRVFR